jgi:hypothetical protein
MRARVVGGMMSKRATYFAVGLIFIVASSCRKKTPEGLPIAYVDAISALADETVKHCDGLLHEKSCYRVLGAPNGVPEERPNDDPKKGIPLPDIPLDGTPELRQLHAVCESAHGHDNPQLWCSARSLFRTRVSSECEIFKGFGSWPPVASQGKAGTSVSVPEDPACKAPWVWVSAVRKTPGGDWFSLDAYFLPKKWLDEHPEDEKDAKR